MAESKKTDLVQNDQQLILARDRYQLIKVLGRGSYGEVWLVSPLESVGDSKSKPKQCVLKRVSIASASDDEKSELIAAERESQLLSSLKHPNIVSYIESFRSRDRHLNIVMAFCEGGDLYTKLKLRKRQLLSEEQIFEWFIQITLALQYMHQRSILHRDLKTQNIFLTKNEIVKVGDLGIARILSNNGADLATTVIGTPYYMSPEIFSNQPYGPKSDIWSLGCCVYEMATLDHAFKAGDITSLMMKIIRGNTPTLPPSADIYSKELVALINAMLSKEASARPTATQILSNPFVKQHVQLLYKKTKQRCQPFLGNRPNSSNPLINQASSGDSDRASMPPVPRPRSSVGSNSNERPNSGTAPVISQARARRQERQSKMKQAKLPDLPKSVSSLSQNNDENEICAINSDFISKVRQNDTLARFKREPQSGSSPVNEKDNSVSNSMSDPRQRRRERVHSVTDNKDNEEDSVDSPTPIYDRSISNDGQIPAVEQERKEKREINEFLNELDATLRVQPISSSKPNESPFSVDRTIPATSKIDQLRSAFKENCLKEISPNELDQILKLLDRVTDTEIQSQIISILGKDLYEKYASQIYMLKYYEPSY